MVAPANHQRSTGDLLRLLTEIVAAHDDLLDVIETKIKALRSGDPDAIRQVAERENAVVANIEQREGLRRQLTVQIARGYGVNPTQARRWTINRLADRIGGVHADSLREQGRELRTRVQTVGRRNHVAQLIAQGVLTHVRQAFAALTDGLSTSAGYVRDGEVRAAPPRIFETVG